MQSDELVDRQLRAIGRLEKIGSVVVRGDLDVAATFDREAARGLRESHDFTLCIRRRDPKRVEPHDDGCVCRHGPTVTQRVPRIGQRTRAVCDRFIDVVAELHEERALAERADPWIVQDRNGATFTLALANASRIARAISGAPGVSPWTHSVSTASLRNVPSTAVTPPSLTNERACRTASAGSVSTEPAIERDCSVPSASYARSTKPSRATFIPTPLASFAIAEPGGATITSSCPPFAACPP